MAEGDLIVKMMSQGEAQVYDSVMKLAAAWSKTDDATRKAGDEARKVAKEEADLARQAARVREEMLTPLDRYNKKVGELDNLLKRGKLTQAEYNQAVAKTTEEYNAAEAAGDKAFGASALTKITPMKLAVMAIAGAVGAVRTEWLGVIENQEKARQATLSVADAESEALVNLGAKTAAERDLYLKQASGISQATGVTLRDIHLRASTALSARGELPVSAAMEAVLASARYLPGKTAAGTTMAGATLDLQKAMAGKGVSITATQALGYAAAIGETARVVKPEHLAGNVMPAFSAAVATGAGEKAAAALFSAFTQAMADETGAEGKTATIKLTAQLRKWLPEKDVTDPVTGELTPGTGLTSAEARIAMLQANRARRELFLAQADIEPAHRVHVESLLSGRGAMAASYEKFRETLPSFPQAGLDFEKKLAVMKGAPLQQTAQLERELETSLEGLRITDQRAARIGVIREKYSDIFRAAGMGTIAAKLSKVGWELSPEKQRDFVQDLKQQRDALRYPVEYVKQPGQSAVFHPMVAGGQIGMKTTREPTAVEAAQARVLDSLIKNIESSGLAEAAADMKAAAADFRAGMQPGTNPTLAGRDQ